MDHTNDAQHDNVQDNEWPDILAALDTPDMDSILEKANLDFDSEQHIRKLVRLHRGEDPDKVFYCDPSMLIPFNPQLGEYVLDSDEEASDNIMFGLPDKDDSKD